MDKPESERRFSWDGVGDAVFRPQYAIVPRPLVDKDPQMAHFWDCAIAISVTVYTSRKSLSSHAADARAAGDARSLRLLSRGRCVAMGDTPTRARGR